MKNLSRFLQYNNAVPIVLSVLVLGGGSVFAATDPAALLSKQQTVMSVDNTYIATKDLSSWSPVVNITAVTEDSDNYYVTYALSTIDVKDYVWQDVVKNNSITVSKADLGDRDLGLYVTDLLNNVVRNESAYLAQVQEKEKASITQKMVATAYGGLIGKFLNDSTETLPGYEPVIPLPVAAPTDPATPIAVATPVPVIQQPISQQIDQLLAQNNQAASSTPSTLDTSATSTQDTAATSTPVVDTPPVATSTPPAPVEATSTDPVSSGGNATSSTPIVPAPPTDTGAASSTPVDNTPVPVSTPTPDPAPNDASSTSASSSPAL